MSEMWRWVDPRVEKVRLDDLRAYLQKRGWRAKQVPQPQVLLYEEPVPETETPRVQLLPASETSRDFRRCVIEVITSLSAVEERHPVTVLDEVLDSRGGASGPNGFPLEAPAENAPAVRSES
jgi:hypothetical protein